MPLTPKQLGQVITERRLALGRRQIDVVNAAQAIFDATVISEPTYRAMEKGRTNATALKLSVVSRALDWPHDALARIRDGADPASIDDDEPVLAEAGAAFDATMKKMTPAELRRVRQLANELLDEQL